MRKLGILFHCLIIFLSFAPMRAGADSLPGHDDPAFGATVDAWLNGDDLEALGSLAQLSRDGNTAAQILLASIANRAHMHVHVTGDLTRKDRVALFRIPGGLSGKSWLSEAEKASPLATALLQSKSANTKAPAIAALVELGEPLSALLAAQSMLFQGEADELIRVLHGLNDKLPKEATALLLWAKEQLDGQGYWRNVGSARVPSQFFGNRAFDVSELSWVAPNPRELDENAELRDVAEANYHQVSSWTPMKIFCQKHCASEVPRCTVTGMSTMWLAGPFAMRSPLETVIPNEAYWASPRIEGDLARQIPDLARWNDASAKQGADYCFYKKMADLQVLHGHAK